MPSGLNIFLPQHSQLGQKRGASELNDGGEQKVIKCKKLKTSDSSDGSSDCISNTPLDILSAIFAHLRPLDILNMGRTSKNFKNLISSPVFEAVWKQRRSTYIATPPDCPPDMSEVAYAELIYGTACMSCGKSQKEDVVRTIWEIRKRLCNQCLVSRSTMLLKQGKKTGNIVSRMFNIPKMLAAVIPEYSARWTDESGNKHPRNHVSTQHALTWSQKYAAIKRPADKEKWMNQEIAKQVLIQKNIGQYHDWQKRFAVEKEAQYKQDMEDRKLGIEKLAEEMGYGKELAQMSSYALPRNHSTIIKLCENELDDEALRIARQFLETHMGTARQRNLKWEEECVKFRKVEARIRTLVPIYESALATYPIYEPRAQIVMIHNLPRITSLVEATPLETALTGEALGITPETISTLHEEVKKAIDQQLVDMVNFYLADKEYSPETVLNLATMVFCWDKEEFQEREDWTYYGFTAAEAALHPRAYNSDDYKYSTPAWSAFERNPWNKDSLIEFDIQSHHELRKHLDSWGLNPETTTLTEINELDPMIECTSCNDPALGRLVMNWSRVIKHNHEAHEMDEDEEKGPSNFVLIQGEDAHLAREGIKQSIERQLYTNNADSEYTKPTCMHCKCQHECIAHMQLHVLEHHHISNPVVEEDFKFQYQTERTPTSGGPFMEFRLNRPPA
ncbi:hypothetical protein BJ165DRAFT_1594066 [Panaeolus papilionaceus]|nr:hypothetical protein BJ165DRAFT_1594066 [Panaeolus papilionaceus]